MKNMLEVKTRSSYIDIIKAFAIILVLLGHSIQYGSGNDFFKLGLYFDNLLFKIIYSFHMPLFMLVSGYLFGFSIKKRKWTTLIINKFKSLVVPILLWSIVPYVISLIKLLSSNQKVSFLVIIKSYASISLGNLWFLWAIFWCSLIVILVNKFFKDNLLIYSMLLLLTFVTPDILNLSLYKFMYPFFIVGYFFNSKQLAKKFEKIYQKNLSIIISGITFIGLLFFYNYDAYIYTTGYCILKQNVLMQLLIDIYRFVIGLIGSVFVMLVIRKICKYLNGSVSKVFLYIGKNSLGIYIISNLVFIYALNKIMFNLASINYFALIIETVLILALSLLCTFVIKKVSFMNKVLLGGR